VAALASPALSSAAWPGANGRIAFDSLEGGGNGDIFTVAPDGTDLRNLTSSAAHEQTPSFSPDGTKIAYVQDSDAGSYDIWVMNADGTGKQRLTSDPAVDQSPSFSPDGKKVVFSSNRNGDADLYVVGIDGTGETRLTSSPGDAFYPQYTRDGARIVFWSNRQFFEEGGTGTDFWTIAPDGSGEQNLTNSPGRSEQTLELTPDGTRIVYSATEDLNVTEQIWTANVDGTGAAQLRPGAGFNPAVSPDGTKILFRTFGGGRIMNADGSGEAPLDLAGRQPYVGFSWAPVPAAPPSCPAGAPAGVVSNLLYGLGLKPLGCLLGRLGL
jgi:TolB protein